MGQIEDILRLRVKPKDKQVTLVNAILSKEISTRDFIAFFESASDVDKGTCADVMKHVSVEQPEILIPYVDVLVKYINYKAPRVKWGVPEAIGNMSEHYPGEVERSIPCLLKNITDDKENTTVVRWCSSFALTEIAKHNLKARRKLIPVIKRRIAQEKNNGVRNLYLKAMKAIEDEQR